MTQEEKAKAYDEALARVSKLESPFHKQAAEIIFPELAESEDERIRKIIRLALIASEEELSTFYATHNITRKECTDWLEKQKEQKPIDEKSVDEIGKSVRKKWAIDFIHFLDEHRYEGKMCVSNGECMDIENAFISADWEKLIRYYNKYTQKPVHTAKEMWKEMRLEVYAQASGNRHEPNYSDDSTKMFSLCDIDEIFEKIGNSIVGHNPQSGARKMKSKSAK